MYVNSWEREYGFLHAVTALGQRKWVVSVGRTGGASPAVGPDGTVFTGNAYGGFFAVDKRGTPKWSIPSGVEQEVGPSAIGPDGEVYVAPRGGFRELDAAGRTLWTRTTDYEALVLEDGSLATRCINKGICLLRPDGTEVWALADAYSRPVALAGDGTIVATSCPIYSSARLYGLTATGTVSWEVTPDGNGCFLGSPAFASDGTLYVSFAGHLYAIGADGAIRWIVSPGDGGPGSPAVGRDGTIYLGIKAYWPDGSLKWSVDGQARAPVALGPDGTVFVSVITNSQQEFLYAILDNSGGPADSPWPMWRHDAQRAAYALGGRWPSVDSDGDGIADGFDWFPGDPSASVDTDLDMSPDHWNLGKSAADSTTGLRLDAFPHDPAASVDTDGDGYPDTWIAGKTQADSTTGLVLDLYPSDPNRWFGDRAPEISPILDQSVEEGQALSFPVAATDPDGDPVEITHTALPAGASFVDGAFAWAPTPGHVGDHVVTFTATAGGLSSSRSVTITVTPPAPKATNASIVTLANRPSAPVAPVVTYATGPGPYAIVAVLTQPNRGAASVWAQQLVYTPAPGYVGADSFTYRVTTAAGPTVEGTAAVTVLPGLTVNGSGQPVAVAVQPGGTTMLTPGGGSGRFTVSLKSTPPGAGAASLTPGAGGRYIFAAPSTGAFAGTYQVQVTDQDTGQSTVVELRVPLAVAVSARVILETDPSQTLTVRGSRAGDAVGFTVKD
ncbi:MAG: Ig-like domain-containing protein, partial [Deferrisomatales bacterium]